jgi:hypothetical protein
VTFRSNADRKYDRRWVLALRALTAEEGLGDDLSAQFAVTKIKTFCFIVYKRMLILVKTFNVDLFF